MLDNLSAREKIIVTGGGALAALLLLWALFLEPAARERKETAQKIETKKNELAQSKELARKVMEAKSRFGALETRLAAAEGPSLISVVENLAKSSGIKSNVTTMEPQPPTELDRYLESSVNIKMEKVSLSGLIDFLTIASRQSVYLRMKRVSIKPQFQNPDLLDAGITICWYERK